MNLLVGIWDIPGYLEMSSLGSSCGVSFRDCLQNSGIGLNACQSRRPASHGVLGSWRVPHASVNRVASWYLEGLASSGREFAPLWPNAPSFVTFYLQSCPVARFRCREIFRMFQY